IDVASRIAAVPENDGSKATVKSWNMDPKLSRQQSAGKPTGDEKRAGAKAFDINSPGENTFAEKPTGDSERASASNMFEGGKNAAAPGNDKNRARVNSWNINTDMEQSSKAEKPGNDTQKAAVKTFDINSPAKNISAERPVNDKERAEAVNMLDGGKSATVNDKNDSTRAAIKAWKAKKGGDKGSRSAVIPTADDARAKVSSWNMDSKKGRQSSAVKPATDTKKAAKKAFNIKNPSQNTFAVKPTGDKNRAEVINFLNGGKRAR
ncbi:MAG: hypothetical protein K6E56_07100, partial [Lachnospiraceae bacterium]|nr:hypothetical protein [Lachnospiraceae bacterium]